MLPSILLLLGLTWDEMMRRQPPAPDVAPTPPAAVSPSPAPPVTPPPAARTEDKAKPKPPTAPAAASSPAKPAPAKPAAPTTWQLADSSGKVWTHTDPKWLSQWVTQRNREIANAAAARPRQEAPVYWASPMMDNCPPGG
jgi:hypothetical protein